MVFLPGQDDIEALQSLLEDNLPGIVGQQSLDAEILEEDLGSKKRICQSESKSDGDEPEKKRKSFGSTIVVKKGILADFEIRPLYAAMPPEEQVAHVVHRAAAFYYLAFSTIVFMLPFITVFNSCD